MIINMGILIMLYIYIFVCGSNGLADKTSNVSKANLNKLPYFDGYQVGFFYYCFTNMTRDNFWECSWDIALSIHRGIAV